MLLVALLLLSVLFVAIIARDLWSAARVPLLDPIEIVAEHLPTITVIIPARNEATRIERCLEGLVAQNLPTLDVIVLDDGSTDQTADVVRSFADRLPGLRLITGQPLPPDWAGKCWACWQAAQASDREWLLFLDADTAPQPALIATLISYARKHHLDLVTLLPLLELRSFWERVLMPPFIGLIQAVYPIDQVNDPRSPLALANGQCILVRRDVYVAVDGHRAVRDSVLEDVRLAQTIKAAGYTMRAVGGPTLLRVRMYTRFEEVAEGLRKNAIAGFRAGGHLRSALGGARQAVLAFGPITLITTGVVLLAVGHPSWYLLLSFGGCLFFATLAFWGYTIQRLNQLHPVWALWYPFGTLCYFALAGDALLSILRGKGVTWKGRTYQG